MTSLRRDGRVTNVELFFDLVYVFAVTQLSHLLVSHPEHWFQAAILLAIVWQVWVYTTWMTNYLDPNRTGTRLTLLVLMLGSLVLAAFLPEAFTTKGWLIALLYAGMQIGRGCYGIWTLRGEQLQMVFVRFTLWCGLAAVPVLIGATVDGHAREALWILGVAIELGGAAVGFFVPRVGRSATTDWTIDGGHFAERCQAFVLIALGESVVITGTRLAELDAPTAAEIIGFVTAFLGVIALWWVYFDRAAEDSVEVIASSSDPGRLGRNAFHWVHPLIVAGIIVTAAADEVVLAHPDGEPDMTAAWLVFGGVALYLAGHAAFKALVWQVLSWQRVIGVVVLLALLPLGRHAAPLTLGILATVVLLGVIAVDRLQAPHSSDNVALR